MATWAEDLGDALATQASEFGTLVTYTPPGGAVVSLRACRLRMGRFEESSRGSRDRIRVTRSDAAAAGVQLVRNAQVVDGGVTYLVANIEEQAEGVVVLFLDRRAG